MALKKYWIKERHNPQTGVYFVACGPMSDTAANRHRATLYGRNIMHSFDEFDAYQARLSELTAQGEKVQI